MLSLRSEAARPSGRRFALRVAMLGLAMATSSAILAQQPAPGAEAVPGLNPADLDHSCKPCEDFYKFANGGWLARNPIPPAYPSWGTFNELAERNREELHQILESAAGNRSAPQGSNLQKIGDFYASCMDEPKIEADGAKPLAEELQRIEAIDNVQSLQAEIARLQVGGVDAVFNFGSTQDEKDSTQVIGGAQQGGLGLPNRDYYTKTDDKSKEIRQKYVEHVTKMFELMGDDAAKATREAQTVMSMEMKLALASMTPVELRDPVKTYHRMDLAQLKTLTPGFSWDDYFHEIKAPVIASVDVAQPDFFTEVNKDLSGIPMTDWKSYLRWRLIDSTAPFLSSKFVEEDFNFKGRTLQGTKELLPRWKRCVRYTDNELGFALGQVYVEKYFPPQAKARALEMVHNLEATLRDDLQTIPWMGPETRQAALTKLDAFGLKIGYPDKWRDYSTYHVDRGPFVLNVMRGNLYETNRDLAKIGKPVDRSEWGMTPPTVNAYYNPQMNEIVFPAGILQPPFFDDKADDAVNYGAMGAVIGHEMTHGFDDEGRQFDAHGNLKDWWTAQDAKNFEARAKCVEDQFNHYLVADDLHENGALVLGESIADLGGLKIAYLALEKSLEGKPRPASIGGFTPEQRFFLSFAHAWATNDRPEFARELVSTDPHPLPRFRAIAAPSNMPAFEKAFDCRAGNPMVRSDRCQIW